MANMKKDPEVTIMGEEFSKEDRREKRWNKHIYHHHDDDGGGVMGAIFIFAGVILLLNVANVLPWGIWNNIQNFWPILIILFGVGILFGHGYLGRFVSGVLSFAIIAGLLLFILQGPFPHILDKMPDVIVDFVNLFSYIKS